MAILTPAQLSEIRQGCERERVTVNYTKAQVNVAVQALEDWFEASRAALSTAVNTATAPLVLTVAQKRALVKYWFSMKFGVE